jgi:hypothetical protein
MSHKSDFNWNSFVSFETGEAGISLNVSPARCDVNRDGSVDIQDLIEILANSK